MNTFSHGVHPPTRKERTERLEIAVIPAPAKVYIPLQQHIGKEAVPTVAAGDSVKLGQVIGKADGAISANVFSSVSGKVIAVEKRATATGHCTHIVIENDGNDTDEFLPPLTNPEPQAIVERIAACGIVGMGGAGFPTAVKLSPKDKIDTLILNGAECEPYLTCDCRLMTERAEKVLRGGEYMAKALGLDRFFVAIEDNKKEAAEILVKQATEANIPAETVLCHTKYPQGAEKQLIYAVTKRKVRVGKLPASVGVIVGNVHTAYCVCEAIEEGKPCYERVLTVSGGAVNSPANLSVRTGTRVSDLLGYCGLDDEKICKLLSGGPMMGFAVESADFAVTKTTSGILALDETECKAEEYGTCINCAACAGACPMRLMPMYIDSYILAGDSAGAEKYGAMNCIECGSCAYVCPAHRPLVQSIRLAKRKIKERGGAK